MKVLITGATGYIGSAVAQAFRHAGHSVKGLILHESEAYLLEKDEIIPVVGDLRDPGSYLDAARECDVLIHCGADYRHDWAASDRQTIQAMLSAGQNSPKGKTVVFTSGSWVYGSTGGRPVDETAPLKPIQVGEHRPGVEQMLLKAEHVRGLVIRPANAYGGREGMLNRWLDDAYHGREIVVPGDGQNHWPMVHVDDLAQGYVMAVERGKGSDVFHFAGPTHPTVHDLVEAIVRVTGFSGNVRYLAKAQALKTMGPNAETILLDLALDASKAERQLGWKANHRGFIPEAEAYFLSWRAWGFAQEVSHASA